MGYEVLGSGAPLAGPPLGSPDPAEVVELDPGQTWSEPLPSHRPRRARRSRRARRPPSIRQVAVLAVVVLATGAGLGALWATRRADLAHQSADGRRVSVVAIGSLTGSFRNGGHGVLTYEVHVQNLGAQPVVVVTGGRPEGTPPLNRTVLVSPTDTNTVAPGQQGQFLAVVMLTCEPGSSIRPQVSLRDPTGQVHVEPLRDHDLDPQLIGAPEVCNQVSPGSLGASVAGSVHAPVLVLENHTGSAMDVGVAADSGLRAPTLTMQPALPVRLAAGEQRSVALHLRPAQCVPLTRLDEASQLRLDGVPAGESVTATGADDHESATVDLSAAMGVAVASRC